MNKITSKTKSTKTDKEKDSFFKNGKKKES
jgi:hypothetical protein